MLSSDWGPSQNLKGPLKTSWIERQASHSRNLGGEIIWIMKKHQLKKGAGMEVLVRRVPLRQHRTNTKIRSIMMNWWLEFGWERMGAVVNNVFNLEKATSTSLPTSYLS